MTKKILITDKVHPSLITRLKAKNFQPVYNPTISLQEVAKELPEYHGIIINSKIKMSEEIISRGRQLDFIARLGSGMEIVDIPFARKKGIRVINTPEGNANAVGEHALGMLLALANNLISANQEVKNFLWNREKNRGFELRGKTIGIIGVGHTGRSFAVKLQGFGAQVLGYDKYDSSYTKALHHVVESTLGDIQRKADIISFHLPLTAETTNFCNAEFLQKCQKGVVIINTSRGVVVNHQDLIKALQTGLVGGACLDVFENEKVATYSEAEKAQYEELFGFQNVLVSPHIAGWTQESLKGIADLVYERILNGYTMS